MRGHVPLQARLVVEVLAAFGARMALLARMVPGVLNQSLAIAALLAAQHTGVGLQFSGVAGVQVPLDCLLLVKADSA